MPTTATTPIRRRNQRLERTTPREHPVIKRGGRLPWSSSREAPREQRSQAGRGGGRGERREARGAGAQRETRELFRQVWQYVRTPPWLVRRTSRKQAGAMALFGCGMLAHLSLNYEQLRPTPDRIRSTLGRHAPKVDRTNPNVATKTWSTLARLRSNRPICDRSWGLVPVCYHVECRHLQNRLKVCIAGRRRGHRTYQRSFKPANDCKLRNAHILMIACSCSLSPGHSHGRLETAASEWSLCGRLLLALPASC